ncbi:PGAM-domain-containing protein [Periconia macrospinosa]|uniref:PGAM-domain-containing protein n=1 Tax=Periconia macrospinosa TaxID=97972 RepID=A0A2V1E2B4_9PLEO|nr:PGAM-domain-containing protein [Periconia macrospinosa]
MIETIHVVRHAFRSNWVVNPRTGVYSITIPTPTGLAHDPPLTAKGVEQAKELALHLCSLDPPIDRVYSSPFYRCLQTLKPTTDRLHEQGKLHAKIRIDRGIGEFFGRAHFTHPDPPTVAVLTSHFDHLDVGYGNDTIPVPRLQGESIVELHERVNKAITRIVGELDVDPQTPKTLLICTHAATMIALGRVLTGNMPQDPDEDDFQCYTASLSTFVRKSSKGVVGNWGCVLNSGTGFLSGGAERGWKFNGEESFVAFPDTPSENKDPSKL